MTTSTAVHRDDYRPGTALDAQLAALAYRCVTGWHDQRPITAALVRSRLHATGPAPTRLATVTGPGGELAAAAALRPTSALGTTGRLWGPLVHPDRQRRGLGTALLDALDPGTGWGPVTTAEIPARRTGAARFFTARGWQPAPGTMLFKGALPLAWSAPHADAARVRPLRIGEDLTTPLAALYAAARPGDTRAADGAFARWTADERCIPECFALAEAGGRLAAAALVLPLAHDGDGDEPAEALVADVLADPALPRAPELARAALAHALDAAHRRGAQVARAVCPDDSPTTTHLSALGLRARAGLLLFQPART